VCTPTRTATMAIFVPPIAAPLPMEAASTLQLLEQELVAETPLHARLTGTSVTLPLALTWSPIALQAILPRALLTLAPETLTRSAKSCTV